MHVDLQVLVSENTIITVAPTVEIKSLSVLAKKMWVPDDSASVVKMLIARKWSSFARWRWRGRWRTLNRTSRRRSHRRRPSPLPNSEWRPELSRGRSGSHYRR